MFQSRILHHCGFFLDELSIGTIGVVCMLIPRGRRQRSLALLMPRLVAIFRLGTSPSTATAGGMTIHLWTEKISNTSANSCLRSPTAGNPLSEAKGKTKSTGVPVPHKQDKPESKKTKS